MNKEHNRFCPKCGVFGEDCVPSCPTLQDLSPAPKSTALPECPRCKSIQVATHTSTDTGTLHTKLVTTYKCGSKLEGTKFFDSMECLKSQVEQLKLQLKTKDEFIAHIKESLQVVIPALLEEY